ncbi:MAG: hydrolase [Methylovulum sp.]|nr:hydrolase [Methylovulum sp.]
MNKHPNLLSAQNSVLVMVDIQTKLTAVMAEADLLRKNTVILLTASQHLAIPVLVTEQYPQGLGNTEPELLEKLPEHTPIFAKTGFACTAAPGFTEALQTCGRKQVILIGQETHVCILQTALGLLFSGYQVHIVADTVCSRNQEHKRYALKRLRQQGATITNSESVLFEWLRDATHPEFKTLSRLLR